MNDLRRALAPLSWDERAKADSGKPIAPATDANGDDCWNVWVTGDRSSPHTFSTREDAHDFATRKQDDGMTVHTDF
jgi:hypothetical protein